jgi:hypothetical protein
MTQCEYTFSDWIDNKIQPDRCITEARFITIDKWGDELEVCPFHYRYLTQGYTRARRPFLMVDKDTGLTSHPNLTLSVPDPVSL